jgi:hypothetical protein
MSDFPAARAALGTPHDVLRAVLHYAYLAAAEGELDRALALYGLARRHPAFSSDDRHGVEQDLALWGLDAATIETGMARGAELDFEATVA